MVKMVSNYNKYRKQTEFKKLNKRIDNNYIKK
jgi:hypothetical protein